MDVAAVVAFVGGLVLLVGGADGLVRGASRLAAAAGVTPLAVGLTVVAFGTSAPELTVSIRGAVAGAGDLAVGNVVGSNLFNLLAILGLTAIVSTLVVHRRVVRVDLPILAVVTLLVGALARDGELGRAEGVGLLVLLLIYTVWVYRASRREGRPLEPVTSPASGQWPWPWAFASVVLGFCGLVLGAQLLVSTATSLAVALGVSELAIGLTIVAGGTSLPELATSVVAAARGQRDIAVGNVVGSNLFNLLGVLGASALVAPTGLPVADQVLRTDLPLSLLATLVVLPCLVTGLVILRWEGVLLLLAYGGYLAAVLLTTSDHSLAPAAWISLVVTFVLAAVLFTAVGWWHRAHRSGEPRTAQR